MSKVSKPISEIDPLLLADVKILRKDTFRREDFVKWFFDRNSELGDFVADSKNKQHVTAAFLAIRETSAVWGKVEQYGYMMFEWYAMQHLIGDFISEKANAGN